MRNWPFGKDNKMRTKWDLFAFCRDFHLTIYPFRPTYLLPSTPPPPPLVYQQVLLSWRQIFWSHGFLFSEISILLWAASTQRPKNVHKFETLFYMSYLIKYLILDYFSREIDFGMHLKFRYDFNFTNFFQHVLVNCLSFHNLLAHNSNP